jgi:hypothetical protein
MTVAHHEVPTHLNVEDKVLFGLTVRQFLCLLVGSSASYALWEQAAPLGDLLRGTGAAVCVLATLAFALLRPAGRALEEWLAAALLFVASPRRTVWRPREPLAADWRPAGGSWQELTPSLVWAEEDDG